MQETSGHCRGKPVIPAHVSYKQTAQLTNTAQRFTSGIRLCFLLGGLKQTMLWLNRYSVLQTHNSRSLRHHVSFSSCFKLKLFVTFTIHSHKSTCIFVTFKGSPLYCLVAVIYTKRCPTDSKTKHSSHILKGFQHMLIRQVQFIWFSEISNSNQNIPNFFCHVY